ncbi:MAG: shikimate dehydrogenase family protein [Bacillota bacterium]
MKNFGLLGEKLSHSKSPDIHKIIFKELDINGKYDLIETSPKDIKKYIEKYDGLNVTIPYKETVKPILKSLSKEAKSIGAVNTIYNKKGYNTDYFGFKKMLNVKNIKVNKKICVILGTGGASKAVKYYLKKNNAKKIISVSRSKKGKNIIDYNDLKNIKGDILINTTPVGMYPNINETPVDNEIISKYKVAVDLIYNPLETLFLKYAKKNNLKYANGLYMLIGQAVKAEEIWNNIEIDNILIEKIYKKLK